MTYWNFCIEQYSGKFKQVSKLLCLMHRTRKPDDLQLIAVKHAKRKGDHEKYPSLEDFNRLKNEPGSVDSYLVAQPLEALSYVLEDTSYAYNIIDKTGDGLALLVTSICRAASQESSGLFSSRP